MLLLSLFMFLSVSINSQEFSFKRIVANGTALRMKGFVSVSDTLIRIKTGSTETNMSVSLVLKNELINRYKLKIDDVNFSNDVRISFTKEIKKKKTSYFLILETKDDFSGSYSVINYFLEPIN